MHFNVVKETMLRIARKFLAAILAAGGITGALAADYPAHPIKWVVPYPPAGTTDVLARIMASWLSEHLGQSVATAARRTRHATCAHAPAGETRSDQAQHQGEHQHCSE